MTSHPLRLAAFCLLGFIAVAAPRPAGAQSNPGRAQGPARVTPRPEIPAIDDQRSENVRQELRQLLERYPPALASTLKLDPTLMTNASYLAPYPALAAFLEQHPEATRYPAYFLDFVRDRAPVDPNYDLRVRAMSEWQDVMTGVFILCILSAAAYTLITLVKYVISHRRWLRATKMQSDVHNKLLERFGSGSNAELMGYMQSPAGASFLQGNPVAIDAAPPPGVSAPLGRILWSIQAGIVLAAAGVGMLIVKGYLIEEVAEMLLVIGVVAIALGIGFALAAVASYVLSHRLGLLEPPVRPRSSDQA